MDPWRRLRLLHRLTFGMWLGWLPFVFIVMSVQDRYLAPPRAMIAALTYMGAFAVVSWTFAFSSCPKCGKPFAFGFRLRWRAPWGKLTCIHCDAAIGDPVDQP